MAVDLQNSSDTDAVTLAMMLKEEANSDRRIYDSQWVRSKRFDGGIHYEFEADEGQSQLSVNLTRNAVNGFLSVMTQEPPESHITPMENDTPGVYYIKRDAGGRIGNSIRIITEEAQKGNITAEQVPNAAINAVSQMEDAQLMGDMAIVPEHFRALSQSTNPVTGQPFLTEDDVFRFDDVTVADLLQRVTDGVWNRYDWEKKIQDVQRDTLVLGHRDVLVEYDDDLQDVQLHTAMERDSWIDPNPKVRDISDAQYYIFAQVMDVETAVKKFPAHEEAIRRNAEDPSSAVGLDGELLSDRYTDIDWERDMAILYTCWIRNQKMAIETVNDGEKIVETVRGLREIKIIGNQLISDGPSRYRDIPAVRFKFITITDSSYSIGLPEMLKDPQEVVNRLFSNMTDHTKFLAHPMSWMVEEVAQAVQNKGAIHHKSNDPITVPMSLVENMKHKPVNYETPPSLDASHIALLNIAMSIFHDVANQGDVVRGIASSKAESGVAIGQLQQAANRNLSLASKYMDHAVAKINKLAYQHMVDFMPPEKWMKYTDKYPLHILEIFIKRAREAEFNVKVETAGTKQQKRLENQQKALLLAQNQLITQETLLKIMEIDNPEEESQRLDQQRARVAQAQLAAEARAKRDELEGQARLETLKTDNEAKLEAVKAGFEAKLEELKAELEIKVNDAKPTPLKASA